MNNSKELLATANVIAETTYPVVIRYLENTDGYYTVHLTNDDHYYIMGATEILLDDVKLEVSEANHLKALKTLGFDIIEEVDTITISMGNFLQVADKVANTITYSLGDTYTIETKIGACVCNVVDHTNPENDTTLDFNGGRLNEYFKLLCDISTKYLASKK